MTSSAAASGSSSPRATAHALSEPSPTTGVAVDAWRDPARSPEARARSLLAQMSLDEKIGQLTQLESGSVDPEGVARFSLGSVLAGGDGGPADKGPASWYAFVDAYQRAAIGTRLGIPILFGIDAVHGNNKVVGATIFPHNIGLGAAGDPGLVERIGRATALEMSAVGIRWTFAPMIGVPQDVRWGRTFEGYGEDPTLVARLGSASIAGLQGADLSADESVAATAKHFVGDGGTDWGSSTMRDFAIDQGVTRVDDATLRAVHLAPYRPALATGARVVMASFSSTPAGKLHGDRHLLTDVLKGELGFSGFVVSDWAGVDQVAPDHAAAVAQSIMAGVDMVMVPHDAAGFQEAVRRGLAAGTIRHERIDDAVLRILRVKFEMGLFERPMPPADRTTLVGSIEHRAIAREAVVRSAVLLETGPGVLPLRPDESVLVGGVAADDIGRQSGGWTITWRGSPGAITPGTTIVDGLRRRLGERLAYDRAGFGPDARADVGIVVVGELPYAEGFGDSAGLALPPEDVALVARMRPLVDRLVVVVLSGRPVMLEGILDPADAAIAAWLPGTEADGLADLLLGDRPFTATTPYTWPLTPEAAPRAAGGPGRFPRGHGLDASGRPVGGRADASGG